jgi:hypothetical protein
MGFSLKKEAEDSIMAEEDIETVFIYILVRKAPFFIPNCTRLRQGNNVMITVQLLTCCRFYTYTTS